MQVSKFDKLTSELMEKHNLVDSIELRSYVYGLLGTEKECIEYFSKLKGSVKTEFHGWAFIAGLCARKGNSGIRLSNEQRVEFWKTIKKALDPNSWFPDRVTEIGGGGNISSALIFMKTKPRNKV